MKKFVKIIFTLIAAISLSGFVYSNSFETSIAIKNDNDSKLETLECKYDQCHAIAKSTEKSCKHCVSNSTRYCYRSP
jgi:hypothetical protein